MTHSIHIVSRNGTTGAFVKCTGGPGSECRTVCCKTVEVTDGVIYTHGHVYVDDDDFCAKSSHPRKDYGRCLWVEWMTHNQNPLELYAGDETVARTGDIHVFWDTEEQEYLWIYVEEL